MKDALVLFNNHIFVLRYHMLLPLIDFFESLIREFQDLPLSCILHHLFLLNGHEVWRDIQHELSRLIMNTEFV